LRSYFPIEISEEGYLKSMPRLLEGCTLDPNRLPLFVLSLGQKVEWDEEEDTCLRSIAAVIAEAYMLDNDEKDDNEEDIVDLEHFVRHVILPSFQNSLVAGKHRASDGSIIEITRLEHLYRVFERC